MPESWQTFCLGHSTYGIYFESEEFPPKEDPMIILHSDYNLASVICHALNIAAARPFDVVAEYMKGSA